jgi:hypothetical protein
MPHQPFEVNYQLPKKKKVTLEDIMNRLDNIDSRLDKVEDILRRNNLK